MTAVSASVALAWAAFGGLWITIGWTDYTRQKISFTHLRWGFASALLGYGILLAATVGGLLGRVQTYHYAGFYGAAAQQAALGAAAGLLMWRIGVWPAGDAKLFLLLSFFFPLLTGDLGGLGDRIWLSVLINIFVPAALGLFLQAFKHILSTRLHHIHFFLRQLGWKRELHFFAERCGEGSAALLSMLRQSLATLDGERVLRYAGAASGLVVTMAAMSVASYYFRGVLTSPLLTVAFWTLLFYVWQKAGQRFGSKVLSFLFAAPLVGVVWMRPPQNVDEILSIFRNISIFSLALSFGMSAALRMFAGQLGFLMAFAAPLLMFAGAMLLDAFRRGWSFLATAHVPQAQVPAWSEVWRMPLTLVCIGLFSGLCLVMVRLWDDEVRPSKAADQLQPYLVVEPAFLRRVEADTEFFERHFSRIYPDGLTSEQAEALSRWCGENGVARVPLAPTISFAFWIFFGFFATRILGGGNVLGGLF